MSRYSLCVSYICSSFLAPFFFNDTATTEIYTLSLHDALPICPPGGRRRRASSAAGSRGPSRGPCPASPGHPRCRDRKSTRLNSSHSSISYAVFCLKKKKKKKVNNNIQQKKQLYESPLQLTASY